MASGKRATRTRTQQWRRICAHALINTTLAAGMAGIAHAAPAADANTDTTNSSAAADDATQLAPVKITSGKTQGYAPQTVETGQYRGMDALDVPATVNVVTHSVMDAQGDTGLYDALRNVAGVTRQQLNGLAYDNLSVRGIPLDNRSSFYLDGLLPIDNNISNSSALAC
ncbi:TonB-dependent receptor plug domain-containing protein [Paraburkholderia sp. J8-2]|uniref:TonB-dependent receptor plug domain-containing protein n=1 Tax=Paraburkholderia sp. J8-2 TaxID=2805440 RepID=UPI002AB74A23|nr:TonB-dependent receptor plug domain-containing protein [Paraburkholderia sp. J8-2]